jgi:hypothetical protein
VPWAEGASQWEKNARGDRCDPKTDGKGDRRRPDKRTEVDQKNHVRPLRVQGEIPHLHVFRHALSKGRHERLLCEVELLHRAALPCFRKEISIWEAGFLAAAGALKLQAATQPATGARARRS